MARSSFQKLKTTYVMLYLLQNSDEEHPVTVHQIIDYLESKGISAERKSIYSDIEALQYMGLDIIMVDRGRFHGYYAAGRVFELPELKLLVDSVQSSKFITREKAREITAKLKKFAGKDTVDSLNRENHVANRVRSMNDSVVKDADRIHQAIYQDLKIGFRYFHYSPSTGQEKRYSKSGEQYIVSPYALLWNNGNYYLYAYDSEKQKFRYFRVDRMERISNPLPYHRDGKEQYSEKNITTHKAKVFDMYGGKEYSVRIRFRNELADAVIDQFGKDVQMFPVDADHFVITEPIEISPPFFAWIATFGRRVKILSPEPVVEKMRDFLTRSLEMYKDDGEK